MRRMLTGSVLVLALLATHAFNADAQAASDHEGVRRAVLDYVEGFYEGDTAKLVRSVRQDVAKHGWYRPDNAEEYRESPMPWEEFLAYARDVRERGRQAPATAPKEIVVHEVLERTASARLTAIWGTDHLLLGKYEGRWMVRMVLWESTPPARRGD